VLRSKEGKRRLKLLALSYLDRLQHLYTKNYAAEIMDENDKHYSIEETHKLSTSVERDSY
jgi:hypothetical protein